MSVGYGSRDTTRRSDCYATPRRQEGHQACKAVREDQAERTQPRGFGLACEGGGFADGQQEPRAGGRVADAIEELHPRCLPVAARRTTLGQEPAEGPDEGAALQPGEAAPDRGPLEHEQEPAATSCRREEPLSGCTFSCLQAGVRLA